MAAYDAIVVGAGVTGSAVARELSRRNGRFLVVERASDVCEGTSKANSAIVHAGFDAEPGTLKAKMNVRGNQLMDQISEELDVPFSRVGAFVVCLREEELPRLEELYQRGLKNGVPDLELLTGDEAKALEPNLTSEVCGALWARTSGIVCPFALTLGLAESAAKNGVEFSFGTAVTGLEKTPEGWLVKTNQGDFTARAVVNAAGVYSDTLHNWACEEKLSITPRKGEYCLLDKTAGGHEDTATTAAGIADLTEKAALSVKNVPMRQVITSFMGLRAHEAGDDFVLGETAECFFDAAGIESPGLTSAPAIGEYLAELIAEKLGLSQKAEFDPLREGVPHLAAMSAEERAEKIRENPAYGNIICRCEEVSEGEILDAIHGILGARTLDGVKRRIRAGMGRCQAGFCSPRVMDLLSRELGLDLTEIRKNGDDSQIVLEKTRG